MRRVAVVEAWVARFDCFQPAVEALCFDADFGDEVLLQVCAEVGRVFGGGVREEVSVDELGDGLDPAHGVGGWLRWS